ncbi:uncharacterized protein CTRU02_207360 [Colletotrichum truncatum]|uniref:Uncharacterized protein n=1 Tax=Colletotrichum truncatum TaxID=5467 RepID=A0ACC3Z0K7_COLTU|nr:uncharacterized protein CTRU02_01004 [Colletotrichum truncatum]KAF6800599.1 hypothetical protein CTRU02_01004 [Colletotrichum truncatum]
MRLKYRCSLPLGRISASVCRHPRRLLQSTAKRASARPPQQLSARTIDSSQLLSPDPRALRNERTDSFVPEYLSDSIQKIKDLAAAIEGKHLPDELHGGVWPTDDRVRCAVKGIRHHVEFAKSIEVAQLCSSSRRNGEVFSRARNARLIMSNTIPEMVSENTKPYCIWHPDLATEGTYRELAHRYPDMRYHVGRACAVAGYTQLYHELNLLPDVSIAEEARDNNSTAIFESIMGNQVKYAVMDDYRRLVHLESPTAGAFLNCDTAVRSSLDFHRTLGDEEANEYYEHYFDIQEDGHISTKWSPKLGSSRIDDKFAGLLYAPLPRDLPNINKDILILAAAWDGNIDRYARLRRPKYVNGEISAVMRGAQHHTAFARWLDTCVEDLFDQDGVEFFRKAINARFIMNNDLSRITPETDGEILPEMFWWPQRPHEDTVRELAWRRPDLKHQCAIACIVCNYRSLFDELQVLPSRSQWNAACQSPNPWYRNDIEKRAKAAGIDIGVKHVSLIEGIPPDGIWTPRFLRWDKEPSGDAEMPEMLECNAERRSDSMYSFEEEFEMGGFFNDHMQQQMAAWSTYLSATDEARKTMLPGPMYSHREAVNRRQGTPPTPRKPFVKEFDDLP